MLPVQLKTTLNFVVVEKLWRGVQTMPYFKRVAILRKK